MAKLQFSHEIVTKSQKQEMVVVVDYDPTEDGIDNIEVFIYSHGIQLAEISTLLEKAEGSPLAVIVESIDWREIYAENKQAA